MSVILSSKCLFAHSISLYFSSSIKFTYSLLYELLELLSTSELSRQLLISHCEVFIFQVCCSYVAISSQERMDLFSFSWASFLKFINYECF